MSPRRSIPAAFLPAVFGIGAFLSVLGCAHRGTDAPQYDLKGSRFSFSVEPVREAAFKKRTYAHDSAQVTQSALEILSQKGVLFGANKDAGGGLVLVVGHAMMGKWPDALVALSLQDAGPGATEVAVAWVDPDTGKCCPIPPDAAAQGRVMRRLPFRDRSQVMAMSVGGALLDLLGAQLDGPPRWKERFAK